MFLLHLENFNISWSGAGRVDYKGFITKINSRKTNIVLRKRNTIQFKFDLEYLATRDK